MTTCKTQYELHHNFPKLADEAGFTFNTHRPRIRIDWNRLRLIDIESLIKDRKFVLIEQHVNDILDCVLESEFDVRILDEGVLKMFRLAQLAVEYQQFCRHYLDRSVYVLREEITSLIQELNTTKNHVQEKDDEIRKLKKKSKYSYRTPLPYGNDNIATMILRTLSNKDIFSSPLTNDSVQYNKCNYCDKVFMNQLYLKGHLTRRHGEILEIPQRDTEPKAQESVPENNENNKLNEEVMELKHKLREMETLIKNNQQSLSKEILMPNNIEEKPENATKERKDAEVLTVDDNSVLDKIEEWKKAEQEKHNAELNLLKTQILESINSLRDKEDKYKQSDSNVETEVVQQLHATIKQQELDINLLKQQLNRKMQNTLQDEELSRRKIEDQISFWVSKAENQSKQYDLLLQKLNDVAKDAKESRAMAETEKQRANQLQSLLEQSLNNARSSETKNNNEYDKIHYREDTDNEILFKDKNGPSVKKPSTSKTNQRTLEQLHRKAQELLKIASSSSSESSINITVKHDKQHLLDSQNILREDKSKAPKYNVKDKPSLPTSHVATKTNHPVEKRRNKSKLNIKNEDPKQQNGPYYQTPAIPGSPVKIIRAKITEEVNNRLVSMGVDPLKNRISDNVFQKHRNQLQQISEKKTKGFPVREKIKNSLIVYLDTKAADLNKEPTQVPEYNSPTKNTKTSKFSSVFSNVKSKALSLLKPANGTSTKTINKKVSLEVAKRAMSLLKTPPDSPVVGATTHKISFKPKTMNTRESMNGHSNTNSKLARKSEISEESESESESDHSVETDTSKKQNKPGNTSQSDSSESQDKSPVQKISKSLDHLIKSPVRRPSSASAVSYRAVDKSNALFRASSTTDLVKSNKTNPQTIDRDIDSNSEIEPIIESPLKIKQVKQKEINLEKQTKSVLKNASSTSSLNKKKVLFDMDAIQMKSVSVSPSQSTEKSDDKEKFALGIINYDGEDWDISSIEEEHLKNDTKIQVVSRTSPKITELKQAIESQLARRRNETPTAPVGGVDVLKGPTMVKVASLGGSNTSLGSSILDDSDGQNIPTNHKPLFKPKKVLEKEDSELDISEISIDAIGRKNDF